MHEDFVGQRLYIGDSVVYTSTNKNGNAVLTKAIVESFTNEMVKIKFRRNGLNTKTVTPDKLVKYEEDIEETSYNAGYNQGWADCLKHLEDFEDVG